MFVSCKSATDRRVTKEIRPITKFRERTYVEKGGIPLLSSKQIFQIDPIDIKRLAKGAHTKDLPEIQLIDKSFKSHTFENSFPPRMTGSIV